MICEWNGNDNENVITWKDCYIFGLIYYFTHQNNKISINSYLYSYTSS
jgi:hypothetical protein